MPRQDRPAHRGGPSCQQVFNMTENGSISLDERSVRMNTFPMSITPKAIQDLLDELEAFKAKPVARLERSAKNPDRPF